MTLIIDDNTYDKGYLNDTIIEIKSTKPREPREPERMIEIKTTKQLMLKQYPIVCECGSVVSKNSYSSHKKSNRHKERMQLVFS